MHEVEVRLTPEEAADETALKASIARVAHMDANEIKQYSILRRSLDARYRPPVYLLRVAIATHDQIPERTKELDSLPDVTRSKEVHIIGAGPAGYFAAIRCIQSGLRPVVFDRGKDVQSRRKDLRAIQQEGIVNPHSNYCFGEGGAGTYSDGKLYTRSSKRGSVESVLKILVECGADPEILIESHPHIGSNKLPPVISMMREVIERHGGLIHFNSWVSDIILSDSSPRQIKGVVINETDTVPADILILATGHSARDIFDLLVRKNIYVEAKPFALGVRVEHSQSFVDECQYGLLKRGPLLPAASYALNAQYKQRGIFSFCMCPGGLIVPAATAPGEIVVNGMSLSRRDSPFANSGIVTSVELEDLSEFHHMGALMGVGFQHVVEKRMFLAGNGTQAAPGQRITDFLNRKQSVDLPASSYIPGLFTAPLHELLPSWIYDRLIYGIKGFNHRMRGFIQEGAVVVGTESRTSSPVRIPRNPENGMHIEVKGLFPCGEGAGYAGGIVSAAMDGQFIANAVAKWCKENYA
jgi:uncharacterized FAD-dependent dehydrogenase